LIVKERNLTSLEKLILSAAKILLGEEVEKKFHKISLSDSTVRLRIDELAENIKNFKFWKI
jgi:hypothetical protein